MVGGAPGVKAIDDRNHSKRSMTASGEAHSTLVTGLNQPCRSRTFGRPPAARRSHPVYIAVQAGLAGRHDDRTHQIRKPMCRLCYTGRNVIPEETLTHPEKRNRRGCPPPPHNDDDGPGTACKMHTAGQHRGRRSRLSSAAPLHLMDIGGRQIARAVASGSQARRPEKT